MTTPRILFIDIETAPNLAYSWGVYEENAIAVREHWYILSYSAEWWDGKHETKGPCAYPGYKPGGDDEKLCQDLWRLLDEADIVVAHNGVDFDIKKINARFIAHGLPPPSPFKTVDTKREVKRVAAVLVEQTRLARPAARHRAQARARGLAPLAGMHGGRPGHVDEDEALQPPRHHPAEEALRAPRAGSRPLLKTGGRRPDLGSTETSASSHKSPRGRNTGPPRVPGQSSCSDIRVEASFRNIQTRSVVYWQHPLGA